MTGDGSGEYMFDVDVRSLQTRWKVYKCGGKYAHEEGNNAFPISYVMIGLLIGVSHLITYEYVLSYLRIFDPIQGLYDIPPCLSVCMSARVLERAHRN